MAQAMKAFEQDSSYVKKLSPTTFKGAKSDLMYSLCLELLTILAKSKHRESSDDRKILHGSRISAPPGTVNLEVVSEDLDINTDTLLEILGILVSNNLVKVGKKSGASHVDGISAYFAAITPKGNDLVFENMLYEY